MMHRWNVTVNNVFRLLFFLKTAVGDDDDDDGRLGCFAVSRRRTL